MKVLVMGAGVIGTASAWYLAKSGHEVTVIDRQPGAGLETSSPTVHKFLCRNQSRGPTLQHHSKS